MKILILDTYYPAFLDAFYARNPGCQELTYAAQLKTLLKASFGNSDFYSRNLAALGHETEIILVNCWPLQRAWVKEHAPKLRIPWLSEGKALEMAIVDQQVRQFRPDVLYVHNVPYFPPDFVRHLNSYARIAVGQNACPLDWTYDFRCYDLIVTSFPHYVRKFRAAGAESAYVPLAFDPIVLESLPQAKKDSEAVFVGGLGRHHRSGTVLMEEVATHIPIRIWGYGTEELPRSCRILEHYQGEAWGLEMFAILASAKVSLNRHIDVAGTFANNMRLFEVTGVGSCLVTDAKDNLQDFFDVDREVVTYTSPRDCIEKVKHLLQNDQDRAAIAEAGQRRTLTEHTYARRMETLAEILEGRLSRATSLNRQNQRGHEKWRNPRRSIGAVLRQLVRKSPLAPLARRIYKEIGIRRTPS